jgi:hypothetical protein
VELGVDSYQNIKEHSPFDYTFIVEFAVDGGGYMAREEYYDNHSFQAGKSRFAKGAAERFEEDVIATLNTVWKK